MFSKNDELEIVKRLSGVSDEGRININEIGWTSRVYIIDGGKIVFKFPRSAKFRNECRHEIVALKLLKGQKFNLSVPLLNWTTKSQLFLRNTHIKLGGGKRGCRYHACGRK